MHMYLLLFYREKIMTTPRKQIKREARREEKAEKAALLEKELEVEYVEGYDELEEEEDMEDFGGFATHKSQAGSSDEEEDDEALDQSRAKRKMILASKKLEKNGLDSKSKKTRVLVEVIIQRFL
ncbi:hypothetical protein V8G54_024895 [Vigna mungo]|uniref:Uncharacterized protein n=1 Tax=Vigna mungo TaxID=3915 RepID=A0AAQ3RQK0_VIGMU